jgi:hypothetical protein
VLIFKNIKMTHFHALWLGRIILVSCLQFLLGRHPASSTTTTATTAFQPLQHHASSSSSTAAAAVLLLKNRPAVIPWGKKVGRLVSSSSSCPRFDHHSSRAFLASLSLRMSSSSSSSSSTNSEDGKEQQQQLQQKKIDGRKKRVVIGYRLAMVLYSGIGMAMLLGPTCQNGLSMLSMAGNYAAGPIMAATLCYILSNAASNNRLSSETYKRANIYLSQYGFVYLCAAALVKWCSSCLGLPLSGGTKKLTSPVLLLASFVALVNGIKGFTYGAKGLDKQQNKNTTLLADFVDVFVTTSIRILSVVPKSLASLGFLFATTFAATLQLATLLDIFRNLLIPEVLATLATSGASFSITSMGLTASKMIQFTRLSLLTCICLTLKDAADRNRLTGTTFILYSALSTFTFCFMSANSLKPAPLAAAAASAMFSIFSAVIALVSIRIKLKESNRGSSST